MSFVRCRSCGVLFAVRKSEHASPCTCERCRATGYIQYLRLLDKRGKWWR